MSFRLSWPLMLTVVSWGFNFVALKVLYGEVEPPAVGLVRFILMWILLVAICIQRGESLRYPEGGATRVLVLGFLAMGIYMVLFLEGMQGSSAAEGAIILATAPIFAALMAVLARQERFNLGSLIGAAIAFVGVVFVVGEGVARASGPQSKVLGNLLILASAVVWAASSVYSAPVLRGQSPIRILTLSMPGALPVLIPYGLMDTARTDWTGLSITTWAMMSHVVVMAGVVGFAGFYAGVRQIGAAGTLLYQYLVPPTAALFAWWVLGQPMHSGQLLGLVIVLAGVAASMHFRFRASATLVSGPEG